MRYIVELESGVYSAIWSGDPGRTTRISFAKRFGSYASADAAITSARKYRKFANARILTYDRKSRSWTEVYCMPLE